MDTLGMNQRISQFHIKHGEDVVVDGNYLRYPDGAYRDRNPLGILAEPSQDERIRLANITKFYHLKAKLAVEEFDTYKRRHVQQAKNALREKYASPQADTSEVIQKLKELKRKAKKATKLWNEAVENEEAQKPQHLTDLKNTSDKNRQHAEKLLEEIEHIDI